MKFFKKNKVLRTPESERKNKKDRQIKTALFFTLLLIIIGGPIYLARIDKFQINNIEIQGTNVTKTEEIQGIVGKSLEGNYLWVFPKSNSFLYPKKNIENTLLLSIPRLNKAHLSLTNLNTLVVNVGERSPYALYCRDLKGEAGSVQSPQDCYFLDEMGFVFSEAPAFSGDVYLMYGKDEVVENPLGKIYLDTKIFKNISNLINELPQIGVHPRIFYIKGEEYHLYLTNGGDIIWKSALNTSTMYSNLSSFLNGKVVGAEKNFLDRILYIDMRFGNKIFYKFRE